MQTFSTKDTHQHTHTPIHSYSFYTPEPISILQGEGKGHQSRKKMVTIPAGSILAFRVAQLLIGSKWGECRGTVSRAQTMWQKSRKSGRLQLARGCCGHLDASSPRQDGEVCQELICGW